MTRVADPGCTCDGSWYRGRIHAATCALYQGQKLPPQQHRAMLIAQVYGFVYGGKACYDGQSLWRVPPPAVRSLHRQGLLREETDPDGRRFFKPTPMGTLYGKDAEVAAAVESTP